MTCERVANRGIIGVKKTYIRFTVLFCSLILAVMVLGVALFTHVQVSAENQRCMNYISDFMNTQRSEFNYSKEDFDVYMVCLKAMQFSERTDDPTIGYYGKCTWKWDQLNITRSFDSIGFKHGSMVIGTTKTHFTKMDITPIGGTETAFTVSVTRSPIGQLNSVEVSQEIVDVEGTTGGTISQIEFPADYDYKMYPMDKEALEKYDYLDSTQHGYVSGHKIGLFTSYLAYDKLESMEGKFTVRSQDVFLFHPLSRVIHNYLYAYILFLIVLVVLQALAVVMMRRVYINRVNYESRTKNLTRSFAHELKTPLAVTKSYVENWDLVSEEDRPKVASKITEEVDHMTKMVNTLLDISKMDAGDFKLNLEDVDLFALSNVCFRHMEELARERNIEVGIRQDKDDGECIVSADLDMMKMVISNFMSNAIKYGKTKVDVLLVNGSNNVTFKITNDGEPISKKDQKRIWDLFYKKDKSGSDRLSSTGVGLAVNRSILEIHKAKFGVESNASETTFWFEMKKAKE